MIPIACPTSGGKAVYLTFDDGPDGACTPQIANYLRKNDARATFFVIGEDVDSQGKVELNRIQTYAGVLQVIKSNGDAIGLHGLIHGSYVDGLNTSYYWNQPLLKTSSIDQEVAMLEGIGITPDPLLRASGGAFSPKPFPRYADWYYYGWDIDSGDSSGGASPDMIVQTIVPGLGASPSDPIIAIHTINPNTAEAITSGKLMDALSKLGYTQYSISLPAAAWRS
ncbi:MAG: polysaccharide deacetylase family protein [Anaerolineales bacterium]